jgi:hypothetical protein
MESAGAEKWADALASWEKTGRKGVTPGLEEDTGNNVEGKKITQERDFTCEAGYYLRPEASLIFWIYVEAFAHHDARVWTFVDNREHVYSVEDDGRE